MPIKQSVLILLTLFLVACGASKKSNNSEAPITQFKPFAKDFTIAFGSCNKTEKPNLLWDDVIKTKPDVWIWGGDNIYADTDDMLKLRAMYHAQNEIESYRQLKLKTEVIGTWDDHDYGLNDGGTEFESKEGSQQEFLNFFEVPQNSPRRKQEGIYTSYDFDQGRGSIKVIILDTRYFRTALTPDTKTEKRLGPNTYGQGTVLGETQWQWLEKELNSSKASFNVIVSSIQVLADEHGFETWGNFPHEVERLKGLIVASKAKGVMILSGDRHISEFSKTDVDGLPYPIIDFTSSGLTHAYEKYKGEPNRYRVGNVIFTESFGLIEFQLESGQVQFSILGNNGQLLEELQETY